MSRANKILIVVCAVLLVLNFAMTFSGDKASLNYDESMFAVQDTSQISNIQIGELKLRRDNGWRVGDYKADPAFVDHLINVLMRVRIRKPIGNLEGGIPIRINDEDSYFFSSNPTKTKTYFSKDSEGFEVEIPGFTDYLGGIFELNADQWRDRLIYNGSWRTIQRLNLNYLNSDQDDFSIEFDKDFFIMEGVAEIDTSSLMSYLNQFQYFQANERISSGRITEMDSMVQTSPLATLTIEDINYQDPITFQIFPKRKEDGYHLLLDPNQEMVAIDAPRTSQLLRKKRDFNYRK